MIRVQDEDLVHGTGENRVGLVGCGRHAEGHVQEIRRVAQVVAREHERLADGVFVGHGRDGRDLGDQPVRGDEPVFGGIDVGVVVVEGRQRTHDTTHDRHGVGVAPEPTEEVVDLVVDHGVMGDGVLELGFRCRGGQVTVEQQVADFHVVGLVGQLFDRVAPVEQNTLLAVDVGQGRITGTGGAETGVVGEVPGLGVELAHVDH